MHYATVLNTVGNCNALLCDITELPNNLLGSLSYMWSDIDCNIMRPMTVLNETLPATPHTWRVITLIIYTGKPRPSKLSNLSKLTQLMGTRLLRASSVLWRLFLKDTCCFLSFASSSLCLKSPSSLDKLKLILQGLG